MDIINLSEQEIYRLSGSSHCHLVGKVLLRRLKCQKSYELWQNKFEEGKEYLLWIGQCHAPNGKSNVFYHFVASPQRRREDAAIFSLVPLDTFDDYPKEDTDMLVEIEGEEYKLIKDFNGFAINFFGNLPDDLYFVRGQTHILNVSRKDSLFYSLSNTS